MVAPAYLNEPGVAAILGKSRAWLKANRPRLEREGFPRVDGLIGLTCVADVHAWIARRRQVADVVSARTTGDHHASSEGIQYAKL